MVFELFRWWYGAGLRQAANSPKEWINSIRRAFSVPILVKTLFSPWRRITSISGHSLDAKVRASVDNLISRLVGFVTRFMVLIAASLMISLSGVLGVLVAVLWPLIPPLIVFLLFKAVTG